MTPPPLLHDLIALADREGASIELAKRFALASRDERAHVTHGWPFGATWTYPSFLRLACCKGEASTSYDRIQATLVLWCLEHSYVEREDILILAAVHHSCELARIDPSTIFERVASLFEDGRGEPLLAFVRRKPEDKAPGAFLLENRKNADGEIEVIPNW